MNIFNKLNQMTNLTENEKILVDFIQNHTNDFISMNASDISKTCFISVSTIYRLCNKLELSGLSEFKILVSTNISEHLQEDKEINFNYPIKQNETQYQIVHKLKNIYDQTIVNTLNICDYEQLRLIASALAKAKHIDIYTSAGNLFFAQNFAFQMQEIGTHVNVPSDDYMQRLCGACSDASHIAMIISFGGRGFASKSICETLKKNKTPIILIGASGVHPLNKYATYRLNMCDYEDHYNKISSFSTRLSLLYILDNLYACFFKLNYEENTKNKLNYYTELRRNE